MPINQDDAIESIRFQYRHEVDQEFILNVEYHQTDIGPTVTIHNLLESGPMSLPLSLYVDVVDYLRQRGAIAGGVAAKMSAQSGGMMARPMTRLTPTRVANSYPASHVGTPPSHVHQKIDSGTQPPAPGMRQVEQVQNHYAPQHSILISESSTEPTGQVPTIKKAVRQQQPPSPQSFEPDPTQEFDPSFTLAAGRERREQAVPPKKTMRRIVKPGEPEFFNPP